MWETQVWSLDQEDPLEKEMATHCGILACKIPWTEESGRLQFMGSQKLDTTDQLHIVKSADFKNHICCCCSVFQFLPFIVPIFAWNVPLVSLIFLKRSLVFPILLFYSVSLGWSLRKNFLFLLALLWNSAFRCLYLSSSPLLFASLLFTAICKASPDSHFDFLHFFFLGMFLIPASCTMSWIFIHIS